MKYRKLLTQSYQMFWTKKYDEFASVCGFYESVSYLARYCLRRIKDGQPTVFELDLLKYNRWIGKTRTQGEYHRSTLARAIAFLDENSQGMVTILKKYNWWTYKILVRPLSFLEQINHANGASVPKPNTGNPMFSKDHKNRLALQQQQNISKLDQFLSAVGLKYAPDNLLKLWRLAGKSFDEVQKAVEYLLHAHSTQTKGVTNPCGFLVETLKNNWHKGFDLYYQVELPSFTNVEALTNFVQGIKPKPA